MKQLTWPIGNVWPFYVLSVNSSFSCEFQTSILVLWEWIASSRAKPRVWLCTEMKWLVLLPIALGLEEAKESTNTITFLVVGNLQLVGELNDSNQK